MKEITSKRSGKIQVITDETWESIVKQGIDKRFNVKDVYEKKLKTPPEIVEPKHKKNG